MIVARIRGRLGNQMFQYAMARTLALERDAELRLDLTHFKFEKYQCRLGAFNTVWKEATLAEIGATVLESHALRAAARGVGVDPCPIEQKASRSIPRLSGRPYIRERPKLIGYDEDAAGQVSRVGNDAYLDGFWQSERWFAARKAQIINELSLKGRPSAEFDEWAKLMEGDGTVAVHVRRGDYQSDRATASVYGVCDRAYYERAETAVRESVPDPQFFVFSDDPDWADKNLKLSSGFSVVRSRGLQEYEEMHLMGRCAHNVISNSTFGWWGAYLNPNPNKTVVAPASWTRAGSGMVERDAMPTSWKLVACG